jgi:hypothetical protein
VFGWLPYLSSRAVAGALLLSALLAPQLQAAQADVRALRPYTASSPWNTPIGPEPRYDPYSERLIATIGEGPDGGRLTSDPDQYSFPVYFVDSSTPRHDVRCEKYRCGLLSWGRLRHADVLEGVPIPDQMRPSRGSDSSVIIIDVEQGLEYNLWQVRRTEDGWAASNGSVYSIFANGTPAEYGSRGAGVPYYAGLIRPWEIRRGRIEHAIAFAYPTPARDRCVYPASKTDGRSRDRYAIPEGARLQLDPALTEDDFNRMGLDHTGKIIARAMQEYGMILIDISGRPKIVAENLRDNPYATEQWTDPDLNLHAWTISAIPHTAFRVLELPAEYWDGQKPSDPHGRCYR